MQQSWLARVATYLRGGKRVSSGCPLGVPTRAAQPAYEFPRPRTAPPEIQAAAIVGALQEEGLTGVVSRQEFLDRYQEHCLMFGFRPIGTNAIFEALGKICRRKRVTVNGHKVTAYVVPEPPGSPWPPNVVKLPNGNTSDEIPFDLPVSARSGASAYAQA